MYKIIKSVTNKRPPQKISEENEICEHVYLPVDSTKEVLACTKCGKLIRRKDIQKT